MRDAQRSFQYSPSRFGRDLVGFSINWMVMIMRTVSGFLSRTWPILGALLGRFRAVLSAWDGEGRARHL